MDRQMDNVKSMLNNAKIKLAELKITMDNVDRVEELRDEAREALKEHFKVVDEILETANSQIGILKPWYSMCYHFGYGNDERNRDQTQMASAFLRPVDTRSTLVRLDGLMLVDETTIAGNKGGQPRKFTDVYICPYTPEGLYHFSKDSRDTLNNTLIVAGSTYHVYLKLKDSDRPTREALREDWRAVSMDLIDKYQITDPEYMDRFRTMISNTRNLTTRLAKTFQDVVEYLVTEYKS